MREWDFWGKWYVFRILQPYALWFIIPYDIQTAYTQIGSTQIFLKGTHRCINQRMIKEILVEVSYRTIQITTEKWWHPQKDTFIFSKLFLVFGYYTSGYIIGDWVDSSLKPLPFVGENLFNKRQQSSVSSPFKVSIKPLRIMFCNHIVCINWFVHYKASLHIFSPQHNNPSVLLHSSCR